MARRTPFGNTWWGRAWVEALERIDYNTNRLPRGRSYARNGRVRKIEIKGGVVSARVQGTRPSPYRVEINLRHFSSKETEKIKDILSESPSVIAAISMGRLPEDVKDLLASNGIDIFPSSWDEIHARCSCPDWANPCKHLAAVYYLIANEIDKDPFLLFNLRGIDTEELIRLVGVSDNRALQRREERTALFVPPKEADSPFPLQLQQLPDTDLPKADTEALIHLLPEKASFYPTGDFRGHLFTLYKGVERGIDNLQIIEDEQDLSDWRVYIRFDSGEQPTSGYILSERPLPEEISARRTSVRLPVPDDGRLRFQKRPVYFVPIPELLNFLMRLPSKVLDVIEDEGMWFLLASVVTARALLRQGLFVPEVVFHDQNAFSVRYVPLVYDEKVKRLLESLRAAMPCHVFHTPKGRIIRRDGFPEVFSLILTTMVHLLCRDIAPGSEVVEVFFRDHTYQARSFEEERTGKAIADYLEGLHIRNRAILPLIRIETSGRRNFSITVDLHRRDDPISEAVPLSSAFTEAVEEVLSLPAEQVRTEAIRQIVTLTNLIPELRTVLDSRGQRPAEVTSLRMAEILTETEQLLNLLGVKVSLPRELQKLSTPRVVVRATSSQGETFLTISEVMEFSAEVALGEENLSLEEFKKLLKKAEGVVRFKDQYVLLTPEIANSIMKRLESLPRQMEGPAGLHAVLSGKMDDTEVLPDDALRELIRKMATAEEVPLPQGLRATLRPYQQRGYRWLYTNLKRGFGCCLADDMGLGKTIQVLALLQKLKEEGSLSEPALVVCPTTLVDNWCKEAERFTPELTTYVYHGSERRFRTRGQDLIITTYGLLRRDLSKFTQRQWSVVVADEAQNIKNPASLQSRALRTLKAWGRIAMTGTPVENRLSELWSIFEFINRGYLGSAEWFRRRYALPIEVLRDRERIEELRRATGPFILRRLKTDSSIISDLPEKVILNEFCHLSPEQAALYQKVLEETMSLIKGSEGMSRKGLIFKLLTALKQICNHPVHYTGRGLPQSNLSGKAEKTISILSDILARGEKALIFTQFRQMGLLLKRMIEDELNETVLFFHGGLQRKKRDSLVTGFQREHHNRVMIVSLKAGGTGLNLTSATNVIHYDLWWNPAVEDQATDRTYRIGQKQNVMVHRLITVGTFEEKIDEMIQQKRELAELTVSKAEQWITELSDRELEELFSLRQK